MRPPGAAGQGFYGPSFTKFCQISYAVLYAPPHMRKRRCVGDFLATAPSFLILLNAIYFSWVVFSNLRSRFIKNSSNPTTRTIPMSKPIHPFPLNPATI